MFCGRFMGAFRTHSWTHFATGIFRSTVKFADLVMAGLSEYFEGKSMMKDGSVVLIIPVLPFIFYFHNN